MRREAQRCLANAMYLKPETGKIFVDVGGLNKFVTMFKASSDKWSAEDDFLLGRLGFLVTAKQDEVAERLVNDQHILYNINTVHHTF